jgi:hypothetical protein
MTEYELHELQMLRWGQIATQYDLVLTLITLYLTVIFAFLAAAHFTGRDMSRFQAGILSSVFSIASFFTLYQLIGLFVGMSFWGEQLAEGYFLMAERLDQPEMSELGRAVLADSVIGWEEAVIGIIGLLGILVSLLFMWSVRHPGNK